MGKPLSTHGEQRKRYMSRSLIARRQDIECQLLTSFCLKAKEVCIGEPSDTAFYDRWNRDFLSFLNSIVGFSFDLAWPVRHSKQKRIRSSSAGLQIECSWAWARRRRKLHSHPER